VVNLRSIVIFRKNVLSDIPQALHLLSSMYLCKPTNAAILNWKTLLAEETLDFMGALKEAITQIDHSSSKELDDLIWDYTKLFVGPYKLPSPPWESVYTSRQKLMMQEAYEEVKIFYKEAGFTVQDPNVMADHIGAELNFLAILYQKNDPGLAKKFIQEHLLRWVSQFTKDMEKAATTALYKTLAKVTRDYISSLIEGNTAYSKG
jgi:TorA maturation chaperone TorD